MKPKRPYKITIKVKQGWKSKRTGKQYLKGKTYTTNFSKKSINTLRSSHRQKGYSKRVPYKIISIKKRRGE